MSAAPPGAYLLPYLDASRQFGAAFRALLWASPKTQRARFDAIQRIHDLHGKSLLDAGCGRGDLMQFLLERGVRPQEYLGLEAVEALADAAENRAFTNARIIRGDFVRDPGRLFAGADVIVFSGSLNTMDGNTFYNTLARAYNAAADAVVFNFLCSPALAGKNYLTWHNREQVEAFARRTAAGVGVLSDYLTGDCTIAMLKLWDD